MKKILSIVMILVTVLTLMIPVLASAEEYSCVDMWVNCDNGKTLNVREEPRTGSRVITRLECGTKVHVDYFTGDGWAAISDYHFSGYVPAKFLVSALARSAKSTSSVGLRVKPNKTSKAIRRLTAGDQLQVIARGKVWSKVVDLQTGKTGYVANDYIRKI